MPGRDTSIFLLSYHMLSYPYRLLGVHLRVTILLETSTITTANPNQTLRFHRPSLH